MSPTRRGRNPKTTQLITTLSEGVLSTTTDCLLYTLFLMGSVAGATTPQRMHRAFADANDLLEQINYRTIKNSLNNLSRKRLIVRNKSGTTRLTRSGRARIISYLPQYQPRRPWNRIMYLISYDIATRHNNHRNRLRRFLRHIGCGLLQDSLWITPYNPQALLDDFITTRAIDGTILVSRLGKDGAIGREGFASLVQQVYQLDQLNERYRIFITRFQKDTNILSPATIALAYHAILKDDPQLPFSLLPQDYLGNQAYKLYRKYSTGKR